MCELVDVHVAVCGCIYARVCVCAYGRDILRSVHNGGNAHSHPRHAMRTTYTRMIYAAIIYAILRSHGGLQLGMRLLYTKPGWAEGSVLFSSSNFCRERTFVKVGEKESDLGILAHSFV